VVAQHQQAQPVAQSAVLGLRHLLERDRLRSLRASTRSTGLRPRRMPRVVSW
jgi:hypothetical protein